MLSLVAVVEPVVGLRMQSAETVVAEAESQEVLLSDKVVVQRPNQRVVQAVPLGSLQEMLVLQALWGKVVPVLLILVITLLLVAAAAAVTTAEAVVEAIVFLVHRMAVVQEEEDRVSFLQVAVAILE